MSSPLKCPSGSSGRKWYQRYRLPADYMDPWTEGVGFTWSVPPPHDLGFVHTPHSDGLSSPGPQHLQRPSPSPLCCLRVTLEAGRSSATRRVPGEDLESPSRLGLPSGSVRAHCALATASQTGSLAVAVAAGLTAGIPAGHTSAQWRKELSIRNKKNPPLRSSSYRPGTSALSVPP